MIFHLLIYFSKRRKIVADFLFNFRLTGPISGISINSTHSTSSPIGTSSSIKKLDQTMDHFLKIFFFNFLGSCMNFSRHFFFNSFRIKCHLPAKLVVCKICILFWRTYDVGIYLSCNVNMTLFSPSHFFTIFCNFKSFLFFL